MARLLAPAAAVLFSREGETKLLELGAGPGRDTLFFVERGFRVTAVDYSRAGIDAIAAKARASSFHGTITTLEHDVRASLPLGSESFDACYSHMLYCMALATSQIEALSLEVRRILRPGGLNVYTVRHTGDAHYRAGIHRGEEMYEAGGFTVHFFSGEKVRDLAEGWDLVDIQEFDERGLPRKLFRVTLRKREAPR